MFAYFSVSQIGTKYVNCVRIFISRFFGKVMSLEWYRPGVAMECHVFAYFSINALGAEYYIHVRVFLHVSKIRQQSVDFPICSI